MGTFWGAVTEVSDLGVVAEHCPHCDRLTSCLLRSVRRGNYVFFIKMAELSRESSCMCTGCLKTFPGKPYWTYAEVVPVRDAQGIELSDLLAKTNPILADRIQFKEQIRELGGDNHFATAYEQIEAMRPGVLRTDLLQKLMDWPRLGASQQAELGQRIGALARAWQFAQQMAIGFPTSAGFLAYLLAVIVAGGIFLCLPIKHRWMWAGVAAAAGLIAVAVVDYILLTRSVCRWTRRVLIPEAHDVNVSLDCFLATVNDVPGSKLGMMEDLWPIKDQLPTIREILIADGKLQKSHHGK